MKAPGYATHEEGCGTPACPPCPLPRYSELTLTDSPLYPRLSSCEMMCVPMYPSPPVTSTSPTSSAALLWDALMLPSPRWPKITARRGGGVSICLHRASMAGPRLEDADPFLPPWTHTLDQRRARNTRPALRLASFSIRPRCWIWYRRECAGPGSSLVGHLVYRLGESQTRGEHSRDLQRLVRRQPLTYLLYQMAPHSSTPRRAL